MGLIPEKKKVLEAERVETTPSSYFATAEFLQCICSVLVAKNHLKSQSRCLVHEFSFTDTF